MRAPVPSKPAARKEAIPISDIYHLIDRLERLLNESWQVPLSTYAVVNENEVLEVIDQMRTAIPQEIRQAERLQQERDRVIAQAEEEGARILQLAREQAGDLVETHEIIQGAKQKSQTIVERAQREAEVLRREADEYAKEVLLALSDQLSALDAQLTTVRATVGNGLSTLLGTPQAKPEDEA